MQPKLRRLAITYGVAFASVAATIALKFLLTRRLDSWQGSPYLLFPIAVLISACYGGFGPGLLATLLSAAAAAYLFVGPDTYVSAPLASWGPLLLFFLEGGLISYIAQVLLDTQSRTLQLARANTESKFREQAAGARIEQAEQRYFNLVNGLDAIVWEASLDPFRFTFVSARTMEMLGYPSCLWVKDPQFWATTLHPDDRDDTVRRREQALAEGRDHDLEYRAVTDDGKVCWFHDKAFIVHDAAGVPVQVRGLIVDVTQRKHAEERLRLGERQQAAVADLGRRALHGVDLGDLLKEATRLAAQALDAECAWVLEWRPDDEAFLVRGGFGWDEPVDECRFPDHPDHEPGRTLRGMQPVMGAPADDEPTARCIPQPARQRIRASINIPIRGPERPFGTLCLYTRRKRTFSPDDVNFLYALAHVVSTVIDRRRGEREMQRQAALLELAHDTIMVRNLDNRILYWNRGAEEQYGWPREEALGQTSHELLQTEFPADFEEIRDTLLREGRWQGELVHQKRDGNRIVVSSRWALQRDDAGEPAAILEINNDITERKQTEERIRELNETLEIRIGERTAQLEEANRELEAFSYSVSHDLRAPLRHIHGFADLLCKRLATSEDATARRYVSVISDSAKLAGNLVDDLLAFSRMSRADMKLAAVDMGQLVRDAQRELAPDTEGRCIEWNVAPLPTALADPALLRLVWVNLLSNAVKFTQPRETARIDVDCHEADGEQVFRVRDNGVGFAQQYRGKLFNVFQRLHTSDEFEGTGIGLANVRRIVQRHGGRAWAESTPGSGATFYFSLPTAIQEDPA